MNSKYKCLLCGRIWRSGEIMVLCPFCRAKPIKIKEGIYIKGVAEKRKSCYPKNIARRV